MLPLDRSELTGNVILERVIIPFYDDKARFCGLWSKGRVNLTFMNI